MLTFKIPDAQFEEGGLFYGKDPARVAINIPLISPIFGVDATKDHKNIQNWQWRPRTASEMRSLLQYVNDGFVEFYQDGTEVTPEQLITIFQGFWQEL